MRSSTLAGVTRPAESRPPPPAGPSAELRPSARGRRLATLAGLGAWLLLAAIVASQNYAEYLLAGAPVSFALQALWMLAVLSYWLAVTPLVLRLAARFPFERRRLVRRVLLHLGLAAVITLAHAPLVVAVTALLRPFPVPAGLGFWRALGYTVTYSFHTGFLLYWVIVGSGAAWAAQERARKRQLDAARLEVELGQARLRALEAQIRPHFLFNALNTVSMLVRTGQNDRAVEVTARLGELLRESLRSAPHHEVPLAREVELARRYLELERCRFERLEVEIDVPQELERALVPHLVLQPLVENAVRHGIARSPGRGRVRISARQAGETLALEVRDDGTGSAPSSDPATAPSSGVGLENIRVRLDQLYGDAGSLSLTRDDGKATVARVLVPYHLEQPARPAS